MTSSARLAQRDPFRSAAVSTLLRPLYKRAELEWTDHEEARAQLAACAWDPVTWGLLLVPLWVRLRDRSMDLTDLGFCLRRVRRDPDHGRRVEALVQILRPMYEHPSAALTWSQEQERTVRLATRGRRSRQELRRP